ncbi:MAG: hypothetical protein WAJ92_03970, partial [Candidatus Acidiferrales bacterium]
TMGKVLLLCAVAVLAIMVLVLVDRYRLELLTREADDLRIQIESQSFAAEDGARRDPAGNLDS